MAKHSAFVQWKHNHAKFIDNRYSRTHTWRFDGGAEISAPASPHVVPPPLSDPTAVDPEEAFVASLASGHMLWYLSIAAERGFRVDFFTDNAVGILAKNNAGQMVMTRVTLQPQVEFPGDTLPSHKDIHTMHHQAHEACFIANSVKTEVLCEPKIY